MERKHHRFSRCAKNQLQIFWINSQNFIFVVGTLRGFSLEIFLGKPLKTNDIAPESWCLESMIHWENGSSSRRRALVFRGVGCSFFNICVAEKSIKNQIHHSLPLIKKPERKLASLNQKSSYIWINPFGGLATDMLKGNYHHQKLKKVLRTGRGFCKRNQTFSCWDWWSFVVTVTVLSFGRWYCSNTLRGVSRYRFYIESFSSSNIRRQIFTVLTTISMRYWKHINIGLVKSCEFNHFLSTNTPMFSCYDHCSSQFSVPTSSSRFQPVVSPLHTMQGLGTAGSATNQWPGGSMWRDAGERDERDHGHLRIVPGYPMPPNPNEFVRPFKNPPEKKGPPGKCGSLHGGGEKP